uniref:Uncharacterized protein n=1 Tax=Anguilla anguilla TaxID=7936 RepID=A0A0E9RQ55_ANGAN
MNSYDTYVFFFTLNSDSVCSAFQNVWACTSNLKKVSTAGSLCPKTIVIYAFCI